MHGLIYALYFQVSTYHTQNFKLASHKKTMIAEIYFFDRKRTMTFGRVTTVTFFLLARAVRKHLFFACKDLTKISKKISARAYLHRATVSSLHKLNLIYQTVGPIPLNYILNYILDYILDYFALQVGPKRSYTILTY